ncbi:MAG: HAD family phosphatase [Candidatus Nanoarchaeia archaeon]|nr:HAD family phosphatase [Candidatus Nanoarchaeia archaeon]
MIKAVIFDFDGVIINTEKPKFKSLKEKALKYGYKINNNQFNNFIGKKRGSYIKEMFPNIPKKDLEKILSEVRKNFHQNIKKYPLIKGIKSLIKYLKFNKIKIAITTGTNKKEIMKILKLYGINKFNLIVSGMEVKSSKPNPECYNITLKKLKLRPGEVIVIEDSPAGVIAAKKTGATVYGLGTYLSKKELKGADFFFKDHIQILKYFKKIL